MVNIKTRRKPFTAKTETDWEATYNAAQKEIETLRAVLDQANAKVADINTHRNEMAQQRDKWGAAFQQEKVDHEATRLESRDVLYRLSQAKHDAAYWRGVAFGQDPTRAQKAADHLSGADGAAMNTTNMDRRLRA